MLLKSFSKMAWISPGFDGERGRPHSVCPVGCEGLLAPGESWWSKPTECFQWPSGNLVPNFFVCLLCYSERKALLNLNHCNSALPCCCSPNGFSVWLNTCSAELVTGIDNMLSSSEWVGRSQNNWGMIELHKDWEQKGVGSMFSARGRSWPEQEFAVGWQ